METIGSVITQIFSRLSGGQPSLQERIQQAWDTVIDKKIKGHSKIEGFAEGVLLVCVDSSAWLYQLTVEKEDLLRKMKKEIPQIQSIRFKIGKVKL